MSQPWSTVPLGELCSVTAGGTPARAEARYWNGDIPWVKISDMLQGEIAFTEERISQAGLDNSAAKLLPAGTLLLSIFATIGRTAVLGIPATTNQAIVGLGIRDRKCLDLNFLRRVLELKSRALEAKARGVAQANINGAILKSLAIPLPPLVEQQRIAEVLDRAEALRAKRRAALAQLESLNQSIFRDLFGDSHRDSRRWPIVPFEKIVRETKLGLVRSSQEFGPDFSIPYVRMNAIARSGKLELAGVQRTDATKAEAEIYRLHAGDFLFNTRNSEELVGKTALFRGTGLCLFNNNLMRIRFTAEANSEFVASAFRTHFVQRELRLRKSGTTNVFAIYYKDLRTLPIPLPPIKLQREFARRVTAVEKLMATQREALGKLDALFSSLQHIAFRGEL